MVVELVGFVANKRGLLPFMASMNLTLWLTAFSTVICNNPCNLLCRDHYVYHHFVMLFSDVIQV